ncbi:zinc ribbon domain-containing protein [Thiomicrospira sp. R3]|nr:zinc ribbon domain-containing protein [Thiomicrospira sp. R3]WFE69754.1 zinc ribbon domain-containing protein [Thiomicrospira sp. R3]
MLKVNPKHTSQTCPCCAHVAKENRLTQSKFECVECVSPRASGASLWS